ncbi:MAG: HAMP domain-containing histidine kinase [Desulfobacteraceae bacterium]|nr:HAMP domain-containing histidine kinase [Desulfobacteraceae bacterium]
MSFKRSIAIYWALVLIPTLIMVVVAFRLLRHEQERISREALELVSERGRAVCETIHITVEGVEDSLSASLATIEPARLVETLVLWERTNPLVRNVFVWQEGAPLRYPVPGMESTVEERRFIRRYDSLFSKRIAWESNRGAFSEEVEAYHGATADTLQKASLKTGEKAKRGRQALFDLARPEKSVAVVAQKLGAAPSRERFQPRSGWIPWFAENRLFLLGWVKVAEQGPVFGVELELMTLLSRLGTDLPRFTEPGTGYALVDGNNEILHLSGDAGNGQAPAAVMNVSPLLPHWQVHVFLDGSGGDKGRGFFIVSLILLAILVAAIVSGGALLTWQAHINKKDALQKTSFVSSVSHELKTPLTSIRMYGELLQSGRVRGPEKVAHYLSVIVAESCRLTRLVNNVLDFSRLEQGRKTYHVDRVDLGALVTAMVELHGIRIRAAGMEPEVILPSAPPMVRTDRDAMEQVVVNIIDNAVKYAAEGKRLKFALTVATEGFCELRISDRGPGIPREHRQRIFDKFHRIDTSLTASKPGSGLGLSIARSIARDLGGDLWFEPVKQGGSAFIVRIKKDE